MTENFTTKPMNKTPGPDGSGGNEIKRMTALNRQSITRPREAKRSRRCRTLQDIYGKEPEIPYVKFEAAIRDLVCSLMERQDRMNEEIFYRILDLAYRLGDLEEDRRAAGDLP